MRVLIFALLISGCSTSRMPSSTVRLIKCIDGILYAKDDSLSPKKVLFDKDGNVRTCKKDEVKEEDL